MNRAILMFSGGQDSATCLFWALEKYDLVETIGFNYNQRHNIELQIRKQFFELHYLTLGRSITAMIVVAFAINVLRSPS